MSDESAGLTRRDVIKAGTAATLAGYAVGVEKALGQAIKTDTEGLVAGDAEVAIGSYNMPVYEARPASGGPAPIVVCVSEIWGVHEWVRDMTRRFAKAGYYAVAPELFKREGGVGQIPNIQDILKIVLAVPRKQVLGDVTAAVDWAKKRPNVRADRAGVTGWCWGGSTVYQVAATNPDIKAGVVWYGPPARPYPDQPNPVTGFDVAKDIKIPMLGLFGETDTGPSPADARKMFDMLKQNNPADEIVLYSGAGHGFMADYRPSYNATAAADAWKRCTGWFDKYLKA
ncbi:MAG TPA: dienelactone hydrolase family protein [Methylomirabilota bacterium]|nr:dienelactone hydrolase family protein [Methylomirabilota bacterium]